MNRLEEIKERLNKGHYIVVHESAYGTPYHDNEPEADVGYLLQRLERYEKALKEIAFGRIEGDYSDLKHFAREALGEE